MSEIDPLKKVQPGDPLELPAGAWNLFIDTARTVRGTAHDRRAGELAQIPGPTVVVRNDSGSDVDRFGILGIDDLVLDPTNDLAEFQQQPALAGLTPDADLHRGKFVIAAEPIRAGGLGRATIDGVAICQVDYPSTYPAADVRDADATQLQGYQVGSARILAAAAGSGKQWAIVLLGRSEGQLIWRGKLDGALTTGSSATVSIWARNRSTGTDEDTTLNVTAYDWLLASGDQIDAAKKVAVTWFPADRRFYVTAAEC
jgi:hypothetical protein